MQLPLLQPPFTHPFTISKGTKTHQPTFIAELDFNGIKGYGEAPAIAYYHIPVEKMISDPKQKKTFVEKFAFTDPTVTGITCITCFLKTPFSCARLI